MYLPTLVLNMRTIHITVSPRTQTRPIGNPLRFENTLCSHPVEGYLTAVEAPVITCDITADIPRENNIVPSVAINGGSLHFATRNPFKKPNSNPTKIIIGMANQRFEVIVVELPTTAPAITEDANITVPMERSIPPVAMTNVTPRPKIAYGTNDLTIVKRLELSA